MASWRDPEIAGVRALMAARRPDPTAPPPSLAERRATMDAFAQRTAEIQAQADDRISTNRLAVESANAKAQTALDAIAAKQERLASILSVGG